MDEKINQTKPNHWQRTQCKWTWWFLMFLVHISC